MARARNYVCALMEDQPAIRGEPHTVISFSQAAIHRYEQSSGGVASGTPGAQRSAARGEAGVLVANTRRRCARPIRNGRPGMGTHRRKETARVSGEG
jgi:hypothetical protein